jgi:hypothetical protein
VAEGDSSRVIGTVENGVATGEISNSETEKVGGGDGRVSIG